LLKYGIPCTFFLATDFIDNQRMYYRNQVSLCLEKFWSAELIEQKVMLEQINKVCGTALVDGSGFEAWAKSLVDEDEVERACHAVGLDVPGYLAHRQPYLTLAQIRDLAAEGFTIGAHSRNWRRRKYSSLAWR
jgi:peptidoglycan/xylan/chitin deacetylase (PgdA/CDA1 family)